MNRKTIAAGLASLALLGAGMAVAQPGPGARPDRNAALTRAELVSRLDARFARLDANRDGSLSAADRDAAVEARFRALDLDGNGAVTLAEMKAGQARIGEARAGRGGGDGPGGRRHRGGRGGGFAAGADANRDGAVSKAEFEARALAAFDRADADHDGVVTPAERHQAHPGRGRGRPAA